MHNVLISFDCFVGYLVAAGGERPSQGDRYSLD